MCLCDIDVVVYKDVSYFIDKTTISLEFEFKDLLKCGINNYDSLIFSSDYLYVILILRRKE